MKKFTKTEDRFWNPTEEIVSYKINTIITGIEIADAIRCIKGGKEIVTLQITCERESFIVDYKIGKKLRIGEMIELTKELK